VLCIVRSAPVSIAFRIYWILQIPLASMDIIWKISATLHR
jgi:hypothetical protein